MARKSIKCDGTETAKLFTTTTEMLCNLRDAAVNATMAINNLFFSLQAVDEQIKVMERCGAFYGVAPRKAVRHA